MSNLYHGSKINGLKKIFPKESGHGNNYVYAVSELAFAALFSVDKRNTFVASWGRMKKEGIPYFCEEIEGIFDVFYKEKSSSIYVLDSKNFYKKEHMWKEEFISEHEEIVKEEIKISDVKTYLLDLEKQGLFKFIPYEARKKYFPNIDNDAMNHALNMVKKYGSKRILKAYEIWRPDIYYWLKKNLEVSESHNIKVSGNDKF